MSLFRDDPPLLPQNDPDGAKLSDCPYRDDALLVWGAIESWVRSYLAVYYQSINI